MALFDFFKKKKKDTLEEQDVTDELKQDEEQSETTVSNEETDTDNQDTEGNTASETGDLDTEAAQEETLEVTESGDDSQGEELDEAEAPQVVEETAEVEEVATATEAEVEELRAQEPTPAPTSETPTETKKTVQLDEPSDVLGGEVIKAETFIEEDPDEKMTQGLKKTRRSFSQFFNELMANFRTVDEDFFEDLEETLITADVGYETAMRITDDLRQEVKLQNAKKAEDVQRVIIDKLVEVYEENGKDENNDLNIQPNGLTVMLFVGVNGVGKTTSIGKLANQYRESGKKVLLAAADTFRAGAIDQLVVWGERAQVEVIRGEAGGDPAAVVFDAVKKAQEQEADILLVDTAGRLQNKVNLMKELEKIKRVIQREIPDAPHEVMLVLDATTGQNAMVQAKQFKEVTDVTGLVLSKLDGTAKGGIVLAIRNELQIPVKLVGLGEGINDLQPFKPEAYVSGLFKGLMD